MTHSPPWLPKSFTPVTYVFECDGAKQIQTQGIDLGVRYTQAVSKNVGQLLNLASYPSLYLACSTNQNINSREVQLSLI